jgi:predicted transcriptional regulator of viral defense system
MARSSKIDKVRKLMRHMGMVRPKDLAKHGIPAVYLRRLCKRGELVQPARGLYLPARREPAVHHSLAIAAKRVPQGVICLLSALQFHGLTTQSPPEVWLAIDRKARRPTLSELSLRIVRFSQVALKTGWEEYDVEGTPVRVTNSGKTVADCFKYRNKIGLDVALEALRDCIRQKKCPIDELWRYAKICRVGKVMRPYFEAMS